MGEKNKCEYTCDIYSSLSDDEIKNINEKYKVISVDWLDKVLVNHRMFSDEYFKENPNKKVVVNNMLEFYLSHKDKNIYKKTDYLCNQKEKICICNTHADNFRKIYDRQNYKPNDKFINWIKK